MPSASRAVATCVAVVAVVLAPTQRPLAAQRTASEPRIPIGAHLRVHRQGNHGSVFTGRLRDIANDSISLALDDDVLEIVPIAYADINRAELERDEKTRDQASAVTGAIGAVGGLTAAVYWCVHNQNACADDLERMQEAADNDESYIGPSALMVLGGALIGTVVGYVLAPQPHWAVIVFPTRTATSSGSTRLLMNVGLSIPIGPRPRR